MRTWCLVVLLAAVSLSLVAQHAHAKFSFALPGKWANNKRGGFRFSLPGKWGNMDKRADPGFGDCSEYDPEAIYAINQIMQAEALRMNECMTKQSLDQQNGIQNS